MFMGTTPSGSTETYLPTFTLSDESKPGINPLLTNDAYMRHELP